MTVDRLVVLTDRRQSAAAGRRLVDTVAAAVDAGAPAVLFREKDLAADDRRALATEVAAVVRHAGARLVVAGDPALAEAVGASGLHLAASDLMPGSTPPLVGRSCHDRDEAIRARGENVDYVTASPVAATRSKPGYGPALGIEGLAAIVRAAGELPVLALGGVAPTDVADLCAAGAHGVAVMGAVMRADDPSTTVRDLLRHLGDR